MLVISTTSKQEQEVFVFSTLTVGSFPIHTASQGARIQVLKHQVPLTCDFKGVFGNQQGVMLSLKNRA